MNILISACLLGLDCRYCGEGSFNEQAAALNVQHRLLPVCPEQLGGLPTPRQPVELVNNRAIDQYGQDSTPQFVKGAAETLKLTRLFGCTHAILKSRSPSCGYGQIYDGTFSGRLTAGNGITADCLQKAGICILNETNFASHLK